MKIYHYSPEEMAEIQTCLDTTKNTTLQRKYQAIYLSMQGHKNQAIADMLHLSLSTIGGYIRTYKSKGLEGLVPTKQTGRPAFISPEQGQALFEVIRDYTPHDVGFTNHYNWTAKLAAAWVTKAYHIDYAESSMTQTLHRLGLSHTRPSYTLAKANKEKQAQFKAQLESEKKTVKWRN